MKYPFSQKWSVSSSVYVTSSTLRFSIKVGQSNNEQSQSRQKCGAGAYFIYCNLGAGWNGKDGPFSTGKGSCKGYIASLPSLYLQPDHGPLHQPRSHACICVWHMITALEVASSEQVGGVECQYMYSWHSQLHKWLSKWQMAKGKWHMEVLSSYDVISTIFSLN